MAQKRGDTAAVDNIRTMALPKNATDAKKQVQFLAEQMTEMRKRPAKEDT